MQQLPELIKPTPAGTLPSELSHPFWLRLGVCLANLAVGFLLAIALLPWAPESSLTSLVIDLLTAPASGRLKILTQGEAFSTHMYVSALLQRFS